MEASPVAEGPDLTEMELGRINDNSRLLSDFKQKQLETQAAKNWDIFYKRNTDKFFKDRHWTTREYKELLDSSTSRESDESLSQQQSLLEVGCGVGNFVFPLLRENATLRFFACDFSKRAVDIMKTNPEFDPARCTAFVCDVTSDELTSHVARDSVDLASLIFVLSAIHPDKMAAALRNIHEVLRPGGLLLFRDYGLHDHAQLRFNPAQKLQQNLYVRQDGTRSFFFSTERVRELFESCGYEAVQCGYVHRETVNHREALRVDRYFVQAKFRKVLTEVAPLSADDVTDVMRKVELKQTLGGAGVEHLCSEVNVPTVRDSSLS